MNAYRLNVRLWDVYEVTPSKKRIGTVVAYTEKQALEIAAKRFAWDMTCVPYRYRYLDNLMVKRGYELSGSDLRTYRLDQRLNCDDEVWW